MSVLTKLLRESYDLQESKGEESAYWHLQKLREAIKAEQIKGETLPIDSVSNQRKLLIAFADWYKTTDFNCEGCCGSDCVDEYLKSN